MNSKKNVRIIRSVLRAEIYVYNRFNDRVMTLYDVPYFVITDPDKSVKWVLQNVDELEYLLDMKLEDITACFVTNHLL